MTKLKEMSLKKKDKENSIPLKLKLISPTHNSLNSRFRFDQETQYTTNLILRDEFKKKKIYIYIYIYISSLKYSQGKKKYK
jgi:hypothetical protein